MTTVYMVNAIGVGETWPIAVCSTRERADEIAEAFTSFPTDVDEWELDSAPSSI